MPKGKEIMHIKEAISNSKLSIYTELDKNFAKMKDRMQQNT